MNRSTRDGASEFTDDGATGIRLKNPESVEALRAALERACGMSGRERLAMGQAARAKVLPLTWQAHVDRWAALIARAAS